MLTIMRRKINGSRWIIDSNEFIGTITHLTGPLVFETSVCDYPLIEYIKLKAL